MDLLAKMATFVRVVEAGSLSAAARQLRLSPAAVSRQVTGIEDELGVSLLARTTRKLAVTPMGRRYYERCLRILRDVDDAQAVGRGGAVDGPLQVTAPVTFGLARVTPHMQSLMRKHPQLRLDLRLEDRLIDLALEGVDVAIRVGMPLPVSTELIAQSLSSFQRVLVAAPRYVKRAGEPRTPEALAKHATLGYSGASGGWWLTDGEREVRIQHTPQFRCNALHAIRELAVGGVGLALLPDWLVRAELDRGELKRVLPSWAGETVSVNAIYRLEHRGAPRVKALIEHLRAEYAADGRRM